MKVRSGLIVGGIVLCVGIVAILLAMRSSDTDSAMAAHAVGDGPTKSVARAPESTRLEPPPQVAETEVVRDTTEVGDAQVNAIFEVVDEDQRPLRDVEVKIFPRTNEPVISFPDGFLKQKSDSHGAAMFTLPQGLFAAIANSHGASLDTFGQGVEDFEIVGQEKVSLRLLMRQRASTLAIDVVDDAGQPISNCEVTATMSSEEKKRTDDLGHVEFDHLEARGCRFEVRTDPDRNKRHSETTSRGQVQLVRGRVAYERVVVPRGGVVRLHVDPQLEIRGRLVVTIRGSPDDPNSNRNKSWVDADASAFKADAGIAVVLASGKYSFAAELDSGCAFAQVAIPAATVTPGSESDVLLPLAAGSESLRFDFVDVQGEAVEGVFVFCNQLDDNQIVARKNGRSDPAGAVTFKGLSRGTYWVGIDVRQVKRSEFAHYGTFDEPNLRVTVPSPPIPIVLQPGCSIHGVVRDEKGNPLGDSARVRIDHEMYRSSSERTTETEDVGGVTQQCFTFKNLRPGAYKIDLILPSGEAVRMTELTVDATKRIANCELRVPRTK